jgi:hypothetical protein
LKTRKKRVALGLGLAALLGVTGGTIGHFAFRDGGDDEEKISFSVDVSNLPARMYLIRERNVPKTSFPFDIEGDGLIDGVLKIDSSCYNDFGSLSDAKHTGSTYLLAEDVDPTRCFIQGIEPERLSQEERESLSESIKFLYK